MFSPHHVEGTDDGEEEPAALVVRLPNARSGTMLPYQHVPAVLAHVCQCHSVVGC
jgi:hypothetical protein